MPWQTRRIQALIKELELRPTDARALSKLAELYEKADDTVAAAEVLLRLARSYEADGVAIKAASVLKRAFHLNGNLLPAQQMLADVYERLGLSADAIAANRALLKNYRARGDQDGVARIIEALARLGDDGQELQ